MCRRTINEVRANVIIVGSVDELINWKASDYCFGSSSIMVAMDYKRCSSVGFGCQKRSEMMPIHLSDFKFLHYRRIDKRFKLRPNWN
jgi:hypothetical protein